MKRETLLKKLNDIQFSVTLLESDMQPAGSADSKYALSKNDENKFKKAGMEFVKAINSLKSEIDKNEDAKNGDKDSFLEVLNSWAEEHRAVISFIYATLMYIPATAAITVGIKRDSEYRKLPLEDMLKSGNTSYFNNTNITLICMVLGIVLIHTLISFVGFIVGGWSSVEAFIDIFRAEITNFFDGFKNLLTLNIPKAIDNFCNVIVEMFSRTQRILEARAKWISNIIPGYNSVAEFLIEYAEMWGLAIAAVI